MNDIPREKLGEIIVTYGRAVCDEPRRCEGLLKDYCGEYKREIFVLVSALRERVAADLLSSIGAMPTEMLIAQLTSRLEENLALSEDAAYWAVESWALALGVISSGTTGTTVDGGRTGVSNIVSTPAPTKERQVAAEPQVVVVSKLGRGDYTTIGAAIADAAPGTRIMVRPGLYNETLVIDRPLEIVGDGERVRIIIESAGMSCLAMKTDYAEVRGLTLRNHAAPGSGIGVCTVDVPQGQLLLEDCDITSSAYVCIEVYHAEANPIIRRSAIHDGGSSGVYVHDDASVIIEDCDIYANAESGIEVQGGNATIRGCKIHHGKAAGLYFYDQAVGIAEGCTIYANAYPGVAISGGSNLVIRQCEIYNGGLAGVYAYSNGSGTIEKCNIYTNAHPGIEVSESSLNIRQCRINRNALTAIWLEKSSTVTVGDCDLTLNTKGAWHIEPDCQVQRRNNRE